MNNESPCYLVYVEGKPPEGTISVMVSEIPDKSVVYSSLSGKCYRSNKEESTWTHLFSEDIPSEFKMYLLLLGHTLDE